MRCPRCQHENPPGMRFCGDCGTPLRQLEGIAHSTSSYADLERFLTEARDQQTATAEILRVIGTSPTDAHPVFEAIACSGVQVCGALSCGVFVVDGEMLHLAATHGVPAARIERFRSQFPAPLTSPEDATRAVRERSIFHMADIENNPAATPAQIEVARLGGYCTRLMVPMLRGDNALGLIAVTSAAPTPFPERQVELLKTFADQAVIAIENVRLFKELQEKNYALTEAHAQVSEALEQQTATSDILRVISSSPTDLQPVMAAVAENAARLCNANDAQIFRADGDILLRVGSFGSMLVADQFPLGRANPPGRAIVDRQVIHVNDIAAEVDTEFPDTRYVQKRQGIRTVLAAPLLREGVPVGAIVIRRLEVQPFSDKQVALLQTFADQAVIAIENVRLFKELQASNRDLTEALEQQTATSEILRVISSSPTDVQPVFDVIVEQACRLCDAVVANAVRIDGGLMHNMAAFGFTPEAQAVVRRSFPMRPSRATMSGRAILARAVVAYEDASIDEVGMTSQEISRSLGGRAMVSVPMLRDGIAVGAITLARRERGRFPERQVNLLRSFAHQAVIALENVRLFKELEARNRDLTEALDRQIGTADVLRIIAQSPTELQPVLEAIATSALRLCAASDVVIERLEGDHFYNAAHAGAQMKGLVGLPLPLTRRFPGGRAILDRKRVIIDDMQRVAESEYPDTLELLKLNTVHSCAEIPLLSEGKPLGNLAVLRAEVRPFTDAEITLLETFADQAVIAIENVRLFKELEARNHDLTESLEQQTATAEILRIISQSRTDVQPVFDAIATSAMRLCGGDFASVFRVEGDRLEPMQTPMTPEHSAFLRRYYPRPIDATSLVGRSVVERRVVHVPDLADPSAPARVTQESGDLMRRSQLTVPMLRSGEPVGVIAVSRRQPGAFSETQVELLKTFADQAVIAIENARLLSELQARTQELTRSVGELRALGEVGQAISSTLDLETVLTTIVSRAVHLSGLDGGVVFEYDEAAEEFVQRVATETGGGALAEARRCTRIRKGEGVLGRTAITLEPVQVADITVPGAHESRLRENLIESGIRAVLAVPMVREGRLIGCLGVTRSRPGAFPAETIELLRTFATQSALAIQNARLFQEIADKSRQLEAASRHKSEFLANMSHELRTPLNAVIGFSEVLIQRMFGALNDKQDEYLKDIYASGQHLLSLINDILDLSKIEAGRMELAPAPFHLPIALENAVTLVRERAARHGITLELDLDPRLGELVGDERKVKQVVLNLLSNAVKFTPEGGRITLKAGRRDGRVEISVADTGIGIAPEDQAAIFEEFRQVGTDETRKQEGTGLGLTLAKKFVELHGGRIWVESEPGRGSTFIFTLPVS